MASDSEEFSSEGAAIFEEYLQIYGDLADGTHLEELKWIKKCMDDELSNRKGLDEEDFKAVRISTPTSAIENSFHHPNIKRLLKHLRLSLRIDYKHMWWIPVDLDVNDLELNSSKLQSLICSQLNRCNLCKIRYKNILKHLKKSEKCMNHYSKEEFEELLQMAKSNKKEKEAQYRKKNKSSIASRKASWYNTNKDKIVAKLEEKKEETSMKVLKYERKNAYQISERKAKYYINNKEKIKARYQERKVPNKGHSTVDHLEYSLKRKPIDFNMADLDAATEEDDDEFKANVGDVERRLQPTRKCNDM